MAKNLVIVESPAKAKTLEKFLGKDFEVKACGGHVRDLPEKWLGVDIKHGFKPTYTIIKGREKTIKTLNSAAQKVNLIFLAPDPDREGEAIAWHLKNLLGGDGKIKRIEFNEITQKAVLEAIKNPRDIDMYRVNAQQARRILDRLVGYKLSPILWKKVRRGLSAGRVQSVAVRLICEREEEIKKFVPKEYWTITATLTPKETENPFQAKLQEKIENEASAKKILEDLEGAKYIVKEIKKREARKSPAPPFITSTLQQEASRKHGFSAEKTMRIAQMLYEGIEIKDEGSVGLITYMRTDSVRIAREAQAEARTYIEKEFGSSFVPKEPPVYKRKKQAQDAHEAIRPTSVFRRPEKIKTSLTPDQFKLYELIWNRFIACQMEKAILDVTTVTIQAKEHIFKVVGSVVKFDGFMAIYTESRDEEEEEAGLLPELKEGEILKLIELSPKQNFTQPPARYTEATLIKGLESKGIGRPSTYAPILSTVRERGYVIREGKFLKPSELGMVTNDQLMKHFPVVMDIKFTAHMEDDLDEIVAGKMDWIQALNEFYTPFEGTLKKAEKEMVKIKMEKPTEEICPECGQPLVIRHGRYGDFIACSGFPKCKYTKAVIKKIGVKCPECGGEILERKTKKGKIFFSCENYPKCTFAIWEKPSAKPCPKCGSLVVEKKKVRRCTKCDWAEKAHESHH